MSRFSRWYRRVNWKFWIPVAVRVVATRSGKVRRVMGKIDNYVDLVSEVEDMARENGSGSLPFADIRQEFKMSAHEALRLVDTFDTYSRFAVEITGLPLNKLPNRPSFY